MKRGIGILVVLITLGALLGATPAAAATNTISVCDRLSWSENFPPYRSHLFVGTHAFGTHTVVYYLHTEGVGSRGYFSSADRTICPYDPIINPGPVTVTATEQYGQAQCTAPGSFAAVVNGKIASYDFVGQTQTYYRNYPLPSTFRFWHIMLQTSPGVWTWWDSVVAIC